ncbi:MAG: zinc dependent phospholipase C family protein [Eggerthellaceae bacterium]
MPAILTHDFFGRDVLHALSGGEALSQSERDAFLLGNQGPDPLFYLMVDPLRQDKAKLGNRMHGERTNDLLLMLKRSLSALDARDVPIGRAYAQGFLCHYLLDSRMHPLVYAQEYAICDAGVEGLDRSDGSAVHAVIESEFDEMVLYNRYRLTIADYSPAQQVLHADEDVLRIIGLMYAFLLSQVYGVKEDGGLYPGAVYDFRLAQTVLYSPAGVKRELLARVEQVVYGHRYSVVRGMSHRPRETKSTWFANPDHHTWTNPWTDASDSRSFADIYEAELEEAARAIALFEKLDFSADDVRAITGDVNFSGKPLPQEA